jgi:glycolate oxidase iron-sulfur subunit
MNYEKLLYESRKCVLCGSCKTDCPTYELKHSEAFGPRGRMRLLYALITKEIPPTKGLYERLYSCLLCGACKRRCPAEVDIPLAFFLGRQELNRQTHIGRFMRILTRVSLSHPKSLYRVFRSLYPLLKRRLTEMRLIPEGFEFMPMYSRKVIKPSNEVKTRGRIALFVGCSVRYLQPYIADAFARVCTGMGYEVVAPGGEVCCGAPLLNSGMIKLAESFAEKNLQTYKRLEVQSVVSVCPTCVVTLGDTYRKLFGEGMEVIDSVSFLYHLLSEMPGFQIEGSAVFHDPCHALYGLMQKDTPRELLGRVGLKLKEIPEGCCGLAGTFSLSFRGLSETLLEKKKNAFSDTGAELLITSCPGCLFQLSKIISSERVFHIVEIFEEALVRNEQPGQ